MEWIFGAGLLAILAILYINYSKNKKIKELRRSLLQDWGKAKQNEYFNIDAIRLYFDNNLHKEKAYHLINDRVANDLDIDALYEFIDRTSSRIGQQYLYYKLRTIESIEKLKDFDLLSNTFLKDENLRYETQLILSELNSTNAYDLERLINDEQITKPGFLKYIYVSSLASLVCLILGFFNPVFFIFLLLLFSIHSFVHYKNKQNVSSYTSAVHQLSKSLKVANQLSTEEKIKQHFPDLTFLSKVNAIQLKTSFISFEKHLTGEFAAVFWLLLELIKIQFMIEYIIFYSFIDSINNQRENIDSLFQFIGKVDAAISTASLKSGAQEYCEPVFVSNKYISTKDIQHPLITNCIPNSICLDGKSLLLTGSNMSGKTTFIRTIALNAVLAQTLNICYAKEYSAQFLKIHSSIRITDSLLNDTSYYLKEVLTIKDLITASKDDSPCLFILDEIFKGTNTIERVSGGKAILSYLNQSKHIVLVSTHDIELTEMLEKDNYDLYHFNESIDDEKLHFDHKLKPGKLKTRNAIKILELYDYPESIVSEARRTEKESFG